MGDIDDTVGAWGFARGGMGAISKALGASFEQAADDPQRRAGRADSGPQWRASGVALANGEEIHAPLVISNMDVKRPFCRPWMPRICPMNPEQVKNFKIRGLPEN